MYKIRFSSKAEKFLRKLSKTGEIEFGEIIEEMREDPYLGKSLEGKLINKYSYRVGVFRVVYKVDKKEKVITIISAGHRSVIYN